MRNYFVRFTALFLLPTFLYAESEKKTDAFDLPQIVAVEKKMFDPKSDFTATLGILPLDAFYKAASLGFEYTRTLSENYRWGIINANAAFTSDTGLKKDLLTNFAVQPQGILDTIKYYVSSDLFYTPIYGKNLLFNQTVVRSEMSVILSAGAVQFNSGGTIPMIGAGGQLRFFSSSTLSYKFDTRLYYHFDSTKNSNFILNLGLGVSFDSPQERQDDKKL